MTIAEHDQSGKTEVASYLNSSGLLSEKPGLIRMDTMPENADEQRVIEGIRKLIS